MGSCSLAHPAPRRKYLAQKVFCSGDTVGAGRAAPGPHPLPEVSHEGGSSQIPGIPGSPVTPETGGEERTGFPRLLLVLPNSPFCFQSQRGAGWRSTSLHLGRGAGGRGGLREQIQGAAPGLCRSPSSPVLFPASPLPPPNAF